MNKELTPEAQKDRDDWDSRYDGGNCSCHIAPPCGSCEHPGNPRNQEEESCWQATSLPNPEDRISPTGWRAILKKEIYEDWDEDGTIVWKVKRGISVDRIEDCVENILATQAATYAARMKEVVEKIEALDYFWQKEAPDKPLVSLDDVLALLQSNPE